ncbi:MAG: DUF881 domain-containing protein [Clostridia bacterium]|nr:DUF881 domain-containing protein [Clostridia bacterium]
MQKKKIAISLGLLTMLFTAGMIIQFKTIRAANLDGTIQLTDRNLKKYVLQWNEKCQESTRKLKDTDKQLEDLKKKVAELHTDEALQEKLDKYETFLGMTDVKGQGIIVTVSDNDGYNRQNNSFASINASNYLVHDGNLVAIVNELKAAGAEAISINDKRITDSTAITCAGNVIQVNGEKVGSPFVIKAIGQKDLLYGEINKNGGTVSKLKKYGVITEIKKSDNIEISKNL